MILHIEVLQIGLLVVFIHRNLPLVLRFELEISLLRSLQAPIDFLVQFFFRQNRVW